MARNKGTFQFAANFEVKAAEALDPRVVVATKAELIQKDTWPHDGGDPYLYNGLIVGVVDEQAVYMLVDRTKAISTSGDYSGWLRIDAAAAEQVDIVDNLTSDRTDAALSAKQGKAIKDILDVKADLEDGKIKVSQLPDYLLGQVLFGGIIVESLETEIRVSISQHFKDKYNTDYDAIAITKESASLYEGVYFISNIDAEETALEVFDIKKGDWIISTGAVWSKVDNTDAVTSVAGLTGTISTASLVSKLTTQDPSNTDPIAKKSEIPSVVDNNDGYITITESTGGYIVGAGQSVYDLAEDVGDNTDAINSLSVSVGNINLVLNGNNDDTDDIPNQIGIIGRLSAVEGLIGTPTEDYDEGTLLTRLDALENLVIGGEEGGDEDQTLLQKVNANTLAIAALEETVNGSEGKIGLVAAVNTLNANAQTPGSVDYKIEQAFKWIEVE